MTLNDSCDMTDFNKLLEQPLPAPVKRETYFANEVDVNKIEIHKQLVKGEEGSCYPLTFMGQTLKVQTPWMRSLFGVSEYSYPNSKEVRYSINLTLGGKSRYVDDFVNLVSAIDGKAEASKPEDGKEREYYSPVRRSHKRPELAPYLRVKMLTVGSRCICELKTEEGVITEPTVGEFKKHVTHGRSVRCILQLNPVWVTRLKWGVSWRLVSIQVDSPRYGSFRK